MASGAPGGLGPDLYATLGVESTAEAEDIKKAYRRLSLTYHPDRRLSLEEKQAAGPHWLKIAAAYDVLADEKKRMVYDELGGANLVEGLALLQSQGAGSVATADDLHREWRRGRARTDEAEHLRRMGVTGSIVVSTSLAEILQPSDPMTPLRRRLKPELSSIAMSHETRVRLDGKSNITLSNQAVTKAGLGGSTLRLGFKRALSSRSSVQLTTAVAGHEPYAIDLGASRRLSAHSLPPFPLLSWHAST
jgi:DnaJ-class molecular chaperone